jgi:hypothetical protein
MRIDASISLDPAPMLSNGSSTSRLKTRETPTSVSQTRLGKDPVLQDFRLSNDFWNNFISFHWNRTATCLRQVFAAPIASRLEILEILKSAAAAYRDNSMPRLMEVYINGGKQNTDLSQYLVFEQESSLEEYADLDIFIGNYRHTPAAEFCM